MVSHSIFPFPMHPTPVRQFHQNAEQRSPITARDIRCFSFCVDFTPIFFFKTVQRLKFYILILLDFDVVRVWFCNRRQRHKKETKLEGQMKYQDETEVDSDMQQQSFLQQISDTTILHQKSSPSKILAGRENKMMKQMNSFHRVFFLLKIAFLTHFPA